MLLCAFVLSFFLTWPTYQGFQRNLQELKGVTLEYQYLSEHYANLERIDEELRQNETALAKIDSALPSSPMIPDLLDYLLKAASQNGLIVGNLGARVVKSSQTKAPMQDIEVEVSVSGSYESLKSFLNTLHKNARMIEADSISFSTPSDEALFSFQINLRTHSQ